MKLLTILRSFEYLAFFYYSIKSFSINTNVLINIRNRVASNRRVGVVSLSSSLVEFRAMFDSHRGVSSMDFSNLVFLASVAVATDTSCTPVVQDVRVHFPVNDARNCIVHACIQQFTKIFQRFQCRKFQSFSKIHWRHDYHDYTNKI